jgi:TolA-binding protein
MTDPKRLLDHDAAFGHELLRAAEHVAPMPAAAIARTLKRVELAELAAASQVAPALTSLTIAKWFGLGLVLGGVSVAIVRPWADAGAPKNVPAAPSLAVPVISAPARVAPPSSGESAREPLASGSASENPAGSAPVREFGLGAEAELVDSANRALRRRDARGALRILEGYARRFPGGQLTPEAELLRLQAFAMLGDFGRVEVLGKRLLREHPESSYADRVRAVLDAKKNQEP